MTRVNLLPGPNEDVRLFGRAFAGDELRHAAAGFALAMLVASIGFGIDRLRIAHLETLTNEAEATIRAREPERTATRRLALEVARLEAIARTADADRASGDDAARTIARLGNTVPANVWLDRLDYDASGFTLSGGARSVDAVGRTIHAFDMAFPSVNADLLSLDAEPGDAGSYRFSARVGAVAGDAR